VFFYSATSAYADVTLEEEMMAKRKVLFLCTGNSARSQMAEGLLRKLAGDSFDVASAGTRPAGLNPLAIDAMQVAGIDISGQESKHLDRFLEERFDYVITVCDRAKESCPIFPGAATMLHWSFEDPAEANGTDAEKKAVFRRIRDEIRHRIQLFLATQQR
jgi:arsenate reductase